MAADLAVHHGRDVGTAGHSLDSVDPVALPGALPLPG
jgi:hypothetical protein